MADSRSRKPMVLVIDNFDSFVHNLSRYFRQLNVATTTVRNNKITIAEIETLAPDAIVISPGPCSPDQAGISLETVRRFSARIPILGVCLGHQAIVSAHGGAIMQSDFPMHGRATEIRHDGNGIFSDLPNPISVGRYHSLIADSRFIPKCLEVSATAIEPDDNSNNDRTTVMAVRHRMYPVVGVQFHPESVLTESGYAMLGNFLRLAGIRFELPVEVPISEAERVSARQTQTVPPRTESR